MRYALGVDLGTTFTGAALGHSNGRVEMLPLDNGPGADPNGSVLAPAVVFATEDGSLITGHAAAERAASAPQRAARGFKRRVGDPTPLVLGGATHSPAGLMAAGLRATVDRVSELQGGGPAQIVLTYPAVWGPYRRAQFAQVPGMSGLSGVRMVPEPVAAAAFYAVTEPHHQDGEVIVVYDLGGETFDATVLRLLGGEIQILGDPEGVDWLGGVDFDEAVLAHVDRATNGAVTALDPADPEQARTLARVRQDCVLAKEALSFAPEVTVQVRLRDRQVPVRLTRPEFEDLIRAPLTSTIEALHRALRSADVAPGDLSRVMLVGGSTRIPLVSQLIEDAVGRAPRIDPVPEHSVALGAAAIAARLLESEPAGEGDERPSAEAGSSPNGSDGEAGGAKRVLIGLLVAGLLVAVGIAAGLYARDQLPWIS